MDKKTPLPCGSWPSPWSSEQLTAQSVGLGQVHCESDRVYWVESRPSEKGRCVLVEHYQDNNRDLTPTDFSVRSRVNEYGGGACGIYRGEVFFCNQADQRLYRHFPDQPPRPVSPEDPQCRYADFAFDGRHHRLFCIQERHDPALTEPELSLVSFDLHTETPAPPLPVATGHDFFASPAISPDGGQLAWLTWDHPDMPWDNTRLWLADLDDSGRVGEPVCIAGGEQESVFQPRWSPDGRLHFVSDRSGWWNLYCLTADGIHALCPREAEFGLPQWVFGMSTYAFLDNGDLVCCWSQQGLWHLGHLDAQGRLNELPTPFTDIGDLQACGRHVYLRGAGPHRPAAIARIRDRVTKLLREETSLDADPGDISLPRPVSYPGWQQQIAHALYYAPTNSRFCVAGDEKPPLLVRSHGGPTAATGSGFNLAIQYWTSRGFAVMDINYAGSTGYGRAYRQRLDGNWGLADVGDCEAAARWAADQGLADAERLAIRGSSAGGYTTLAALTFTDTFSAGASLYGISDLQTLAQDTHKFESRYLDSLIGPWPDRRADYEARSPIHHVDQLSAPMILLQGLEDRVVPPAQAESMAAALDARQLPVAYIAFEGEQHGFRQAANIRRALDAELYFYGRIFGFTPADEIEPVDIHNLD